MFPGEVIKEVDLRGGSERWIKEVDSRGGSGRWIMDVRWIQEHLFIIVGVKIQVARTEKTLKSRNRGLFS
jgi:hypothetical protein